MFYVRGIICSITSTLPQACSNTTKYYCGCGFRCKLWSNRAAKGVQSIAPVIFSTFAMERTPCQQWKIQCKWGKSDPRKVKNPPGATVQKTCGVWDTKVSGISKHVIFLDISTLFPLFLDLIIQSEHSLLQCCDCRPLHDILENESRKIMPDICIP